MNQAEFKTTGRGESQCALILKRLQEANGGEVEMPELWRVSGAFAVHSRCADLRKRGHNIEQRSERCASGIVKSFYRLVA